MDTILRKPENSRLSVSDHLAFHKEAYVICKENETPIADDDLITSYKDAVEKEENIYKWIRRSEFTEKKAEADQARDRTYTGITGVVNTAMKHFDPSLRDNAKHVHNLLVTYGNPRRVDYDAETVAIESIISRLRSADYLPAVQALGLVVWVNELESQNNLFKSYVQDVVEEKLEKPEYSMLDARLVTDKALQKITDRVSAKINLNGITGFTAFVEKFNVVVNHYNTLVHEHYGRLHTRTDISEAFIDPIEVQPYTGKPVFVIPGVNLRKVAPDGTEKIIELIFSQDFSVSYKNNVEPGTATLFIHGIGQYTGQLITTFNIVKS